MRRFTGSGSAAVILLVAGCVQVPDANTVTFQRTSSGIFKFVAHGWCSEAEAEPVLRPALSKWLEEQQMCPGRNYGYGLDRAVPLDHQGPTCPRYDFYYSGGCAFFDPPPPSP